jgi:hypothetical protein
MISDGNKGIFRRLSLISRFGRVNARAYVAILRAVVAERLWSVPRAPREFQGTPWGRLPDHEVTR